MSVIAAGTIRAIARNKAAFEETLATIGTVSTWKQRTATTPDDGSAISGAAGRPDPVVGWQADVDNTDKYSTGTTIRILKDVPANRQDVDAGMIVTGTAMGQVAVANVVEVGDVIVIAGVPWYVDGARLVSPPIYREVTLRH